MEYTFEQLKHKTVAELRDIAKGNEHEALQGYTQLNKEHLLVALSKALGIKHEHHDVGALARREPVERGEAAGGAAPHRAITNQRTGGRPGNVAIRPTPCRGAGPPSRATVQAAMSWRVSRLVSASVFSIAAAERAVTRSKLSHHCREPRQSRACAQPRPCPLRSVSEVIAIVSASVAVTVLVARSVEETVNCAVPDSQRRNASSTDAVASPSTARPKCLRTACSLNVPSGPR